MDRAKLVEAYFDAWNAHEADAIVATFAPSGTYSDPTTPGPLEGAAIGHNAAALWAAFPDVKFEITSHLSDETGLFSAQWTMTGSNSGSFAGLPPTGRSVVLRGADFIRVGAAGIERVEGYFSPGAIPHQLGMQVVVQPSEVGPFQFGTAVRVRGDIHGEPGAFSITSLKPKNAEDVERVRELSRATAAQMTQLDGFMGWVGATIGDRMLTITAWSSPEDSKQVMRLDPHRQGTKGFFGTDVADGGWVSVWTPLRIGPMYARCSTCGAMTSSVMETAACVCGAELPSTRHYW
jgi:steroid delta-isomerase-like uncharacterized protein